MSRVGAAELAALECAAWDSAETDGWVYGYGQGRYRRGVGS
jgi:hypothetical protein